MEYCTSVPIWRQQCLFFCGVAEDLLLIQVFSHYCSINISPNYINVNHMNENSHNIDLHNIWVIKFEFEGSFVVRFITANLLSMHKQGEQATEQ